MSSTEFKLGVVVLGAGASSRMGRPKLLLAWRGNSVVGHIIAQWRRQNAAQIAVVCRPQDSALTEELARNGLTQGDCIINPSPEVGMFSSVRCAALWRGWLPELTHWAIALGDQPQIGVGSIQELIQLSKESRQSICQPSWKGRPRHPIILPKPVFFELGSSPAADLKQFLRGSGTEIALCPMDDPGLDQDLDTPEDYERMHC